MLQPKIRNASALLLTRGEGDSLHVLLVERAPGLRFFGGYLACPGGVRDPIDGPDEDGDDTAPLARCAVREAFEELGPILLDHPHDQTQHLVAVRQAMLVADSDPAETAQSAAQDAWANLTAELPPIERLVDPICRMRTPPFAPVLYDTVFFHAAVGVTAEVEIIPGELVGARWWRPAEALDAWRRGEVLIVPPVLILLELLAGLGGDIEQFTAAARSKAARYAAGDLHEVRFSPGVVLAPLRTPTLPPATTTNTLIVGTKRLWIVDPASPDQTEQERLFALLDSMVDAGSTPEGILLTHHHPDHVGAVEATAARYDVSVQGHARTLDRVRGSWSRGRALEDGDTIELGDSPDGTPGWTIEALFTPGHDRGHLCFRESRYGALIAGDMVSTVSTIVIDPPEGHLATYIQSLERLAKLDISTLYPAHGPAVRDGNRVVQHYLRHRQQRESSLVQALKELEAATARELTQKVYWDARPELLPLATRSLVAGLMKLEAEGRAVRTDPSEPEATAAWRIIAAQ